MNLVSDDWKSGTAKPLKGDNRNAIIPGLRIVCIAIGCPEPWNIENSNGTDQGKQLLVIQIWIDWKGRTTFCWLGTGMWKTNYALLQLEMCVVTQKRFGMERCSSIGDGCRTECCSSLCSASGTLVRWNKEAKIEECIGGIGKLHIIHCGIYKEQYHKPRICHTRVPMKF